MGDRCAVELTVRTCDVAKLTGVFEEDGSYHTDTTTLKGFTTLMYEEVNYGGQGDLDKMADFLDFWGSSGAGGDYLPAKFVAFDGEFITVPCNEESEILVRFGDLDDADRAEKYFAHVEIIKESLPKISIEKAAVCGNCAHLELASDHCTVLDVLTHPFNTCPSHEAE